MAEEAPEAVGNPRSIPCPKCGAVVGEPCRNTRTPSIRSDVIHAQRVYDANARAVVQLHADQWAADA